MLTEKQIEEELGWREGGIWILDAAKLKGVPSYYEPTFPKGTYPFKFHFYEEGQHLWIQRFHSDGDIIFNGRCRDLDTLRMLLEICKDGTLPGNSLVE